MGIFKLIIFMNISFYVVYGSIANAYELATHGRLAHEAYNLSVLANPNYIAELGIQMKGVKNMFGITYYDVSGNQVEERIRLPFEEQKKRMPDGVHSLSLEGWLLRGAIREDDWTGVSIPGVCEVRAPNPQDDPYFDDLDRPLNHFFDPVFNRALTVLGAERGEKAPDWGLGAVDTFSVWPIRGAGLCIV